MVLRAACRPVLSLGAKFEFARFMYKNKKRGSHMLKMILARATPVCDVYDYRRNAQKTSRVYMH